MSEEQESSMKQNMLQDNDLDDDLSSPTFQTQLTEDEKAELVKEALAIKTFFENFEQEFNEPANEYFYIISVNWLKKWKRYSSYDKIIKGEEPDQKWFGQVNPGKINEDIVQENHRFAKYPDPDDYRNVFLKDQIQEKRDYELISEGAWKLFAEKYNNIPIKRPAYLRPNGARYVEVALKQVKIVPVNNAFLKEVDNGKANEFKLYIVQATAQTTLDEFRNELVRICNAKQTRPWFESSYLYNYSAYEVSAENLRFWKLDPAIMLKTYFREVKQICEDSRTYDYQIEFKGTFLEKDTSVKLDEAQIAHDDYVFLEARESSKGWTFYGDGAPILSKCEFCNKYGELKVQCACKKVAYCSEDCRNNDKRFHRSRCDKAGEDEEQESKNLVESPNSKLGLVGLQNLGNTCFMNSGLQCMSNIPELTQYFLLDKYLAEINESNPLGTQGGLVKKYAAFLKNLWYGSASVYSPWALKAAIARFQPMFSGYQQHDSQELLAFLIDGIHEDLNRVKEKPFTETIESEDQADYDTALKSWVNHLKRNQSIVVDLLHGQFKSKITCPTCNRVSVTFDPFSSVSLPIPIKKEKEIDFYFIHANNRKKAIKLAFSYNKTSHTVADLRKELAKRLGKNPENFFFMFLTYHSKEIVTDEGTTLTNQLRKKKKFKNLFALEFPEEDVKADSEDRISVDIHTTKKTVHFGNEYHKPQTFLRPMLLKRSYTLKQLYIRVFEYYRFLFDESMEEEEKAEWLKLSSEEAFEKVWGQAEKKPFTINIMTSSIIGEPCYFCGEVRCDNCKLQCDESIKLADLMAKIKDPNYNFELEVVFDTVSSSFNLDGLNGFIDSTKRKASGDDDSQKEARITIYDCFNQFELPEQLGEENAWYCSKCKEHQKATKKMEIYKAPPILILHFKRFKSGNTFFRNGKIGEQVDFPTEDLDLTNYVINGELPMDYPVDRIAPTFNLESSNQENPDNSNTIPLVSEIKNEKMNIEGTNSQGPSASPGKKVSDSNTQMPEEAPDSKPKLLYNLFAVVNHYGNLGFGHYTAYGKNHKNNNWYCFDDSSVSEESAGRVCTPAAYVLFYKRKDWEFKL